MHIGILLAHPQQLKSKVGSKVKYPVQRENQRKLPDVGNVILYKLLPKDSPTNPDRLWRGRVAKVFSGTDCVEVTVLEQGYEGLTEIVMSSQIVQVDSKDAQERE